MERSEISSTSSSYGAAFLAGLGSNIWNNIEDLKLFRKNVKIFEPNNKGFGDYDQQIEAWKATVQRFANCYK